MGNFRKIFTFMFIFVFVLIIAQIALYVFLGYSVLTDPEGSGEVIGKFMDGVNK